MGCLATTGYALLWTTRQVTDTQKTFARTLSEISATHTQAVADLVLGRPQDSIPSSEPSSTGPSETSASKRDEFSLDDMPEHIAEAYRREAAEDGAMTTRSMPYSTPLNGSSSQETIRP